MKLPETYLIEKYLIESIDNDSILRILTQSNPIKPADPAMFNYYKKLANWACEKHRQDKLTNIYLNTIKLSDNSLISSNKLIDRYNTLGSLLNRLKSLMDDANGYNSKNDESNLIQQTTLEILAGLSKIPIPKASEDPEDDEEDPPKPDPDPKSGKSRDWTAYRAEKLAKVKPTSKALDEFYDEYYSQEYAGVESPEKDTRGIVAKLKSLDKILIPEFNKLGYNIEVNPFASFLKILIKAKETSNIFEKLTYNTYGAIHNSFIEKYITGNMLGQKFDEKNILFCSDLYNNNGLDMVEYLNLQHQVNAAKKTSERADDTDLIAKIFIKQNIPQAQEGVEDSYSAKVKKLLDLKENINQPGQKDAKLRSLLEIRELFRYIFGKEADSAAKKKQVDTRIADAIANKAEELQITLDMIGYILDQATYTASDKYANDARKFEAWFDKLNHHSTKKAIKNSKEILSKYELTAYAFSLIIKNLVERVTEQSGNKI